MSGAQELPIDTSATAMDMAQAIFGSGVQVSTASYSGAQHASGIYSNGDAVAPGVTPSDTGVILSTGSAEKITNSSGAVNRAHDTSTKNYTSGDSDLDAISGVKTYDAAVFEASFVPDGSTLTMQVSFSSEEYLEYVNSGFNDVVGIIVNGEKAELTVGDGDITINNINDESNENLYLDNPRGGASYNTEMDGLTVTLTLKAPVVPGQTNTIKIAIADGGDNLYDSNLLIAGDSVQSALVAGDDDVTIHGSQTSNIDILANDSSATGSTLTIVKINGVDVSAGDMVTLPSGETITLNEDGTLSFVGDGDADTNTLTYTVEDADGNTDVGYINLTTIPCFTAGTRIQTIRGLVPVEALRPGDLVQTRDAGFQPVLWLGMSVSVASGDHAPIRFEAGTLGDHDRFEVSPNHRMLITSANAQLWFGTEEVLVRAQHLINGTTIRRRVDARQVTYVHILFATHQIVLADGVWSESYQPGDETMDQFDAQTRDELFRLVPQIASAGYPAARLGLKRFEAQVLAL